MSGVALGAAAIGAVGTYAASQSGGDSKAGGQPMYTMANLPSEMQNRVLSQMNSMPMGMNVNYKGQNYPMMYGPQMRAIKAMYSPQGSIPYQNQPSGMSSAMSAMAPYMYMMANQIKNQNGGPYFNSYDAGNAVIFPGNDNTMSV
jgi:hypothetical protein